MDWGIFPYGRGDKYVLAKVGEEGQLVLSLRTREQRGLHGLLMAKQFAKGEVSSFQHAPVHRRPFRKDDMARLLTYCSKRQGVAPYDVSFENKPHCLAALVLRGGLEQTPVVCVEYLKEPSSAIADIVRQNINAVDRGDG